MKPARLAVLISGGGSTLLNLLDVIAAGQLAASVELVIASRSCAGVDRSIQRGYPCEVVSPKNSQASRPTARSCSDAAARRELIS